MLEYSVLVTTTIIETGVDIPNTGYSLMKMQIIWDFQHIYQLRVRVGKKQSGIYFIDVSSDKSYGVWKTFKSY